MAFSPDLVAAFADQASTVPVLYDGATAARGFFNEGGEIVAEDGIRVQSLERALLVLRDALPDLRSQSDILVGALGAASALGGTSHRVLDFEPIEDGAILALSLGVADNITYAAPADAAVDAAFADQASTVPVLFGGVTAARGFLDESGAIVDENGTRVQTVGRVLHIARTAIPDLALYEDLLVGELGAESAATGVPHRILRISPLDDGAILALALGQADGLTYLIAWDGAVGFDGALTYAAQRVA